MPKKIFGLLLLSFFLSGCSLLMEQAGVEIMSEPEAKVFIDGKEAGTTPYKNNSLAPKETEIKLVTSSGQWLQKIRLQNRTSTIINREFNVTNGENGGYVLKIEPTGEKAKAGLIVNTRPDRAIIKIDGETKGTSPNKWDDIGSGEKQIDISFPAKKKVVVFAKAIDGYQLIVDTDLIDETIEITPTPSVALVDTNQEIIIKDTETGWLRVRGQPNTMSIEVGKVKPGEKYQFSDEKDGYYEIELDNGVKGWISTKYADKISVPNQKIGQ